MKKKRTLSLLLALAMAFSLTACQGSGDEAASEAPAEKTQTADEAGGDDAAQEEEAASGGTVQGVSDTTILVGNTAATTGSYAAVGVPFNAGIEAAFKEYNDAGGFNGLTVELIHYDDGFDAAQGMTYTQTLVEDDQVFALVGHFGTNTVGATLDYLKEVGIPMMYAATGVSDLYQEGATGNDACIFPVQPIYDAEGRVLLARALASEEDGMGLGATKVGVISTTDDAGSGMLAGIKRQAEEGSFDIAYQEVDPAATDYTAAVNVLKNAGCDVVIAAMNQAPLATCMNAMRDVGYDAKVLTSYVSASVATMTELVNSGAVTADRPIYATAWMDVMTDQGAAELEEFMKVQVAWEEQEGIAAEEGYSLNSYAMAGYVAAKLFLHGLDQVAAQELDLTWENYIAATESAPYHIPMGGDIDFAGGDRLGVTALALNTTSLEINPDTGYCDLITVSPITSLDDVWAAVAQ